MDTQHIGELIMKTIIVGNDSVTGTGTGPPLQDTVSGGPSRGSKPWLRGEVTIPLYSLIFILAVVGNLLVILTLAQNKRMRTITNVFLMNLSISDLLLAVFCMPFTLIPTLMQNFIFGHPMCILVRYMQGIVHIVHS